MISIFQKLFTLVLWPNIHFIVVNVPHVFEKHVFFVIVEWRLLYLSVNTVIISFKSFTSLMIFCLVLLPIIESVVWKSPTVITELILFSFNSVSFWFTSLGLSGIYLLMIAISFKRVLIIHLLVAHSCLILWDPMDCVARQAPPSMGFSRQEFWSGLPFFLQGIFPAQGSNLCLLHCRQILHPLSQQGNPVIAIRITINVLSYKSLVQINT